MLITALKKERKELFDAGRQAGRQESIREIITAMLLNGFSVNMVSKITGLNMETVQEINNSHILQS